MFVCRLNSFSFSVYVTAFSIGMAVLGHFRIQVAERRVSNVIILVLIRRDQCFCNFILKQVHIIFSRRIKKNHELLQEIVCLCTTAPVFNKIDFQLFSCNLKKRSKNIGDCVLVEYFITIPIIYYKLETTFRQFFYVGIYMHLYFSNQSAVFASYLFSRFYD